MWNLRACGLGLALAVTGCVVAPERIPDPTPVAAAEQWRTVETQAPLVGAAFLECLVAFSENDPGSVTRARARALDLARQAGVVTVPAQVCNACPAPRTYAELQGYQSCLRVQLNCLHPR
ncbi:MAG TPA: hypothetical protein VND93_02210 [Myxococcales bacterium]|nr:hypothetical protein [Myxococcales bacterium]